MTDDYHDYPAKFPDVAALAYRLAAGISPSAVPAIANEAVRLGGGFYERKKEELTSPLAQQEFTAALNSYLTDGCSQLQITPDMLFDRYLALAQQQDLNILHTILEVNRTQLIKNIIPAVSTIDLGEKIRAETQRYHALFGDQISESMIHDLILLDQQPFLEAAAAFFRYTSLSAALNKGRKSAGGEGDYPLQSKFPFQPHKVREAIFRNIYGRLIRTEYGAAFEPKDVSKTYAALTETLLEIEMKLLTEPHISASEQAEREEIVRTARAYVRSLETVNLDGIETKDHEFTPNLFQIEGTAALLEKNRIILGDDVGVGKTFQMILAHFNQLGQSNPNLRALIITPYNMKEEIEERYGKYLDADARNKLIVATVNSSADISRLVCSDSVTDTYTGKTGPVNVLIVNHDLVNRMRRPLEEVLDEIDEEPELESVKNIVDRYVQEIEHAQNPSEQRAAMLASVLSMFPKHAATAQKFKEWRTYHEHDTNKVAALYALVNARIEDDSTLQQLLNYRANFIAVDEAHAAKSPYSLRGQGILELTQHSPYLMLMTGTLIPNRIEDMISALKMVYGHWNEEERRYYPVPALEKRITEIFPSPREARLALLPYLVRRTREEVFPRTYTVTHHAPVEVASDILTQMVYTAILESERLYFNEKLLLARRASVNPLLVVEELIKRHELERDNLPDIGRGYVPPKYQELARILFEILLRKEKTVVYTSYVDGITAHRKNSEFVSIELLPAFLERTLGVPIAVLDGVRSKKEAADALKQFAGNTDVLVVSYGTGSEGIDFSVAQNGIHLDNPYVPTLQPDGRIDRRTQTKDVNFYTLVLTDEQLRSRAMNHKTIDETVVQLNSDKETIMRVVLDGAAVTDEEIAAYQRLVNIRDEAITSSDDIKLTLTGVAQGSLDTFLKGVEKRGGSRNSDSFQYRFFEEYITTRLFNPDSHTAKVNQSVAALIQNVSPHARILDIGGGPGSLSAASGRPLEIFDMLDWEYALLEIGCRLLDTKSEAGHEFQTIDAILRNVKYRRGFMDSLPYAPAQFDIASMIYSLHWTTTDPISGQQYSEREAALRQATKTLAMGGRLIVALPTSKVGNDAVDHEKFNTTLTHLGYQIVYAGRVREKGTTFKTFIGVAQKTAAPNDEPLEPYILDFASAKGRMTPSGAGRIRKPLIAKPQKSTGIFLTEQNISLSELLSE